MKDNQIVDNLFIQISTLIDGSRKRVYDTVINESTSNFYLIGKMIVEQEQHGNTKAEYGKYILRDLSIRLNSKYGRGYSITNLQDYRRFYSIYSKQRTVSVKSVNDNNFKLSLSIYLELCRLDARRMAFYEQLSLEQDLKVRELKRLIKTNTYERVGQSYKPNSIELEGDRSVSTFNEIHKDPYILEFLGLPDLKEGEENKLEKAIINNLQTFLIELGRGFAFVGRQYRLNIEGDNFFVDLVFFNIPLNCYVIFELKTSKAEHNHIGQLQLYVNYFDRVVKLDSNADTIGVLLCADKNDKVVEFALPKNNTQIFASKYELYLPDKKQLELLIDDANEMISGDEQLTNENE